MQNLVFTSGYGYPPTYLEAFLKSISRNMKSADVILFYHDTSERVVSHLRDYLETVQVIKPNGHAIRRGISFIPLGRRTTTKLVNKVGQKLFNEHSSLLAGSHNINFARYLWVADYCDRVDIRQYKRVMLCDSRDVIVQSDVFDKIDNISFVTGLEDGRIREDRLNQEWIYEFYGKDALRELWDELIVCSGVSLGPRQIVLEYVRRMAQELKRCGIVRAGGDQGLHNFLIRSNALKFPVHLTKSTDGIIGTLHFFDKDRVFVNNADNISVENGVVPSIVHQYDRFPKLSQHVARIYGSFDPFPY
jgi:hypothetical protein